MLGGGPGVAGAIVDGHAEAGAGEFGGDAAADAAGCAGDQGGGLEYAKTTAGKRTGSGAGAAVQAKLMAAV